MLGLHDSASCCYSDSNELFRLHYRFLWAYVDSSQTISSHWIFIYLFFSFFSHFLSFKAFLQKYIIMWMTYWHFLKVYDSSKTSTVTVSCLDIVIRISSVPERWRGMVVLASKKESQRQVHRWRKTPPEHYLVTAVQEKKNLQNFFCLWYGLRGIENSHLQSDFPHHLTEEQKSGQFLKIKEIEFQLPVFYHMLKPN